MRITRGVWCCALAIAACSGSGGGSGGGSGASGSAAPSVPSPPPLAKVALVRCAPAQPLMVAPRAVGILGSASASQGAAFASLTGTGDISSGLDDKDLQGGLLGNEPGEMNGGFGFGRSGFGPGGGTGVGTIGTGKYGTIGHGSGTGTGYGIGGGRGGMHGRMAAEPTVRIGQPSAVGDLDKAIIRRYIKRNISKIQYCYEKELLAKPALKGTVSTQFFISPNGDVPTATASGVDPTVASCVAGVLKGIEFPKPKGGGGVQVNYPFVFRVEPADTDVATTTASAAPSPPATVGLADVDAGAPAAPPAPAPAAWAPFELGPPSSDASVANAVVAVQAQVQARLGAIDGCFGALAGGAARAMIDVDDGGATTARVGGLGKGDVEACVARELGAIKLDRGDAPAAIACDLSRGPEQPWRVTPDAYDVVEVSRTTMTHGASSWPVYEHGDPLDGTRDALVIASPDATGVGIQAAAVLTRNDRATLFALRDSGGAAPLYLAEAPSLFAYAPPDAPPLELVVHADTVELCGASLAQPAHASTRSAAELDTAFRDVATACRAKHCGDAAVIDPSEVPDVASVVTILDHARAAGFSRVAMRGDLSCAP